ncbi:MAG: pseudouridine synthase [Candidatus Taylorbacteria bacterium]
MRKPPTNQAKSLDDSAPLFPMRINKYLALKGYATRRGADELIARKIVTINGRLAVLGDKVSETDNVEVRKNKGVAGAGAHGGLYAPEYVYYACNKPRGVPVLDTRKGTKGFINALLQTMPPTKRGETPLFPVGSLDPEAEGLIIFTNDRRIIDRLENPKHAHVKQYHVETLQPLRANFKEKLEAGVSIDGSELISCRVMIQSPTSCYISIADPKNRIRQICALFGAEIANLKRTAILNIQLGKTESGSFRKIEGDELALFLKNLGL